MQMHLLSGPKPSQIQLLLHESEVSAAGSVRLDEQIARQLGVDHSEEKTNHVRKTYYARSQHAWRHMKPGTQPCGHDQLHHIANWIYASYSPS